MNTPSLKTLLAAGLLACGLSTAASAQSTYVFSSFDTTDTADIGFIGGVMAVNGDINADGVLLRLSGLHGTYSYALGAGENDVDVTAVDAMVGYQTFRDGLRLSGYIGVEHRDSDLALVDPNNPTQGDEVGAKVQLELATTAGTPLYLSLIGSYSTAFDTYWTRGRVGYDFGGFVIGPELMALGDEGFDQIRYGGFVDIQIPGMRNVAIGLSGGGVDSDSSSTDPAFRSEDDAYAHIAVAIGF
ncbi:MAG: cellulose biosynthesis protein BcsS [Pseudomonadota bacterium]